MEKTRIRSNTAKKGKKIPKLGKQPPALPASKAFSLCCTLEDAGPYREELAFFQAIKAVLTKADPKQALTDEAKEHAMRQIVSGALVSG